MASKSTGPANMAVIVKCKTSDSNAAEHLSVIGVSQGYRELVADLSYVEILRLFVMDNERGRALFRLKLKFLA